MDLYWAKNALHVRPCDEREKAALLLLVEFGGIRKTWPSGEPDTASGLEVELTRRQEDNWKASIPAIAGIESFGLSERDAYSGIIIKTLRFLADQIEQGKEMPANVNGWFATTSQQL